MLEPRKIHVAIAGGGLSGAAIARVLYRQPHIEVNVYESARMFSEKGMAIGLAINAQQALAQIVPDAEELLQRAGAVKLNSSRIMLAAGPYAGTKVIDIAEAKPGKMLHRAALLHELLAPIPKEILHVGEKISEIKRVEEKLLLKFQDGEEVQADALIGADGIFGTVRAHVLGVKCEATKPVAAGWAGIMNLVPHSKAEVRLGADFLNDGRQYGWVIDGGIFILDTIMGGKMVQCIGTCVNRDTSGSRRVSVGREYLDKNFASCSVGSVAKGMTDLLLDQESPGAFAQYEYKDAPTFVKGRVCIVGDAAHSMTPWQGSGAATALEDAVILGALFKEIKSPDEIEHALRAYDAVRRPRAQSIAESSRQTGLILSGMAEGVGLDPTKMHDALQNRWAFIHDFDLARHIEDAKACLRNE